MNSFHFGVNQYKLEKQLKWSECLLFLQRIEKIASIWLNGKKNTHPKIECTFELLELHSGFWVVEDSYIIHNTIKLIVTIVARIPFCFDGEKKKCEKNHMKIHLFPHSNAINV